MRYTLILAPLPALIGSLVLMKSVSVSTALIVQQTVIAIFGMGLCFLFARFRNGAATKSLDWMPLILLAVLLLSLLSFSTSGPHRWVNIGGCRLYVAALVLPAVTLLLARALRTEHTKWHMPILMTFAIAACLAIQPDASQITAFALAASVAVLYASKHLFAKLFTVIGLAALCTYAWLQPDPLVPVPYVEGVLDIARTAGAINFFAALLVILTPPLLMAWLARASGSQSLIIVAIYYMAINILAFFQLTPMPFLGFGASPILGYFIFAALALRGELAKAT
jgi:hypothetical protein